MMIEKKEIENHEGADDEDVKVKEKNSLSSIFSDTLVKRKYIH